MPTDNIKFGGYAVPVHIDQVTTRPDSLIEFEGCFINEPKAVIDPFEVKRVIFNNPATIVFWADGTKTVAKCSPNDEFSEEIGFAEKFHSDTSFKYVSTNEILKQFLDTHPEYHISLVKKYKRAATNRNAIFVTLTSGEEIIYVYRKNLDEKPSVKTSETPYGKLYEEFTHMHPTMVEHIEHWRPLSKDKIIIYFKDGGHIIFSRAGGNK